MLLFAWLLLSGLPPRMKFEAPTRLGRRRSRGGIWRRSTRSSRLGWFYAHATGAIETKQKYMDRLKSGAQKYDEITQEETKVIVYGDSAVTHSIMRMTGVNQAGPFNDHVMMMHLWVKQGGSWRLAAHQTTKLP